MHDIDIENLSVRPSVRLSLCRYVPVSDENGLTYRHSFSPYGSPIILVLPSSNIQENSDGVTPAGALNTGVFKVAWYKGTVSNYKYFTIFYQ